MPIETLRPDQAIQQAAWSIAGPPGTTLVSALADDSDATYIQNSLVAQLDSELCKVGISDMSLPTGAKIFSVRARVRVQQVLDPGTPGGGSGGGDGTPSPRCFIVWIQKIIQDAITLNIPKLFRDLFGFRCPRPKPPPTPPPGVPPTPPVVAWETVELAYFTQQPAGGEWTLASFNDFVVGIGRGTEADPVKISGLWVDVDWNAAPVCVATGPTGNIDDRSRPTITWTYADPESDPCQAWNVRVFNNTQYTAVDFDPISSPALAESGWTLGEDLNWTVNRDLANGNYRAYVTVEQAWRGIGEHRSQLSHVDWVQAVPGPPVPSLAAYFEPDLNRVRLELNEGGPTPETISYNLEFSDTAGITWELVRDGVQITVDANRSAIIHDYEAPLNQLRKYRAQAFRQLSTIKVASGFSNVVDVVPTSEEIWAKDPIAPVLNTTLWVVDDDQEEPRSYGEFTPLVAEGKKAFKIPVIGPQYGVENPSMHLAFRGEDDVSGWDAFRRIYESGRPLLMQFPTGEQHYISFRDNIKCKRQMHKGRITYRLAEVGYVEVEKPWNRLQPTF